MEDGSCLVLIVFYRTLFFLIQSEFKMKYNQPEFQQSTLQFVNKTDHL